MKRSLPTPIEIPDATREPAAYVRALVETLGDRDPLETYAATAGQVTELCDGLTEDQWRIPMAVGEWSAAQIVGHLTDVDIVYGFRWRLVLTENVPAYPGYNEKLWSELPRPDPTSTVSLLRLLREANVALLRGTSKSAWQRLGRHDEQGSEGMQLMLAKIAGHDMAHVNQLERTIAAARASADQAWNVAAPRPTRG